MKGPPWKITPEVAEQMDNDLRIFGQCFARIADDGVTVERVDPTVVQIAPEEKRARRVWP